MTAKLLLKNNFQNFIFYELFSVGKSLRQVLYHNEVVNQEDPGYESQLKRGERNSPEDGGVRC